jgi:hypothetical protein
LASASRIRGRLAHGGVMLVPVRVHGQDFEFLVDTGAAYTALSTDVVALLGMTIDPQRMTATAPVQGAIMRGSFDHHPRAEGGGFWATNVNGLVATV